MPRVVPGGRPYETLGGVRTPDAAGVLVNGWASPSPVVDQYRCVRSSLPGLTDVSALDMRSQRATVRPRPDQPAGPPLVDSCAVDRECCREGQSRPKRWWAASRVVSSAAPMTDALVPPAHERYWAT